MERQKSRSRSRSRSTQTRDLTGCVSVLGQSDSLPKCLEVWDTTILQLNLFGSEIQTNNLSRIRLSVRSFTPSTLTALPKCAHPLIRSSREPPSEKLSPFSYPESIFLIPISLISCYISKSIVPIRYNSSIRQPSGPASCYHWGKLEGSTYQRHPTR